MQILGSIVPWNQPPNIKRIFRIAMALSLLMPEDFKVQHHTLSARLCGINPTAWVVCIWSCFCYRTILHRKFQVRYPAQA